MLYEFLIIFLIFLVGYYFLPVFLCTLILSLAGKQRLDKIKIQQAIPPAGSIKREIKWSVCSIIIFSLCATLVYQLIKKGNTNLYYDWDQSGMVYFFLSPFICILFHDTYYYWLHRTMHHKNLFKYFHRVHHLSVTPTPWAIYSFQPLEAFFTFLSFALVIVFIPIHPIAFSVYMLISLINNIGGHTGYEFLPGWFARHRILKYSTVVTFHDLHHTNNKYNFGAYFNIWDRIMKTMHREYEKKFTAISSKKEQDHR